MIWHSIILNVEYVAEFNHRGTAPFPLRKNKWVQGIITRPGGMGPIQWAWGTCWFTSRL